jgi:hypothetical protein
MGGRVPRTLTFVKILLFPGGISATIYLLSAMSTVADILDTKHTAESQVAEGKIRRKKFPGRSGPVDLLDIARVDEANGGT